jgi:hypothetical protein
MPTVEGTGRGRIAGMTGSGRDAIAMSEHSTIVTSDGDGGQRRAI